MLCNKVSHQQKFDIFSTLCIKLSQSKHVSSSGLSGVVVIFLRAILQVCEKRDFLKAAQSVAEVHLEPALFNP